MAQIRPIRNDTDYEAALARIDDLMSAELNTPEGDELDVLTDLVELYEAKTVPMGFPSPVDAILFRMEQSGLSQRDLVPLIGGSAKVSEVLSGKRDLTLKMVRALHSELGISAEVLLQDPGASLPNSYADVDWSKFPIAEMMKLGWIKRVRNLKDCSEEIMRDLIARAGGDEAFFALYRKNDHIRLNVKSDPYALKAWCWQALAIAHENPLDVEYRAGTVTVPFMRQLAKQSWSDEGPKLAKEFLEKHGIHFVVLPHLKKTHLDGAAIKLKTGAPMVALTLRHDRLDNFWFCLMHELAHIGRHMHDSDQGAFVDEIVNGRLDNIREDEKESEADEWAKEALIPSDAWIASEVRGHATPDAALSLAKSLGVHPAIIAGRVRKERQNFHLLTHFVGNRKVRKLFFGETANS